MPEKPMRGRAPKANQGPRRYLSSVLVLLIGAGVLAVVQPAAAADVTISAAADSRVLSASPTVNSGTVTRLDVDSPGEQSYLRFNVTGVTGTVQTATLRLFVRNSSSNAPSLYFTDNTWTETGITWNNKPPATSAAIANVAAATSGTWSEYNLTGHVTGNGTYNFVLLPDSTDGIQYDSREGTSPPQLVLNVDSGAPTNAPPVAGDDTATTPADTPVTINVAGNDTDPNGNLNPTTTTATATPTHGTLTNNANGTFTYTPTTGYTGPDTFTYQICDTDNACDTATVTITVTPVATNAPPVAGDDTATTPADTPVTINVAGNDTDPNGNLNPTTTTATATPTHGTLTNNANGTFTYTPTTGYTGPDTFTYQICDTDNACDTATVTITVTPVATNAPPVAGDDTATTPADTPVTINVAGNDTDPNGNLNPTTTTATTTPTHGTLTNNANGTFTYTPTTGYTGPDTFTYQICDTDNACDTATVTINVNTVSTPQTLAAAADSRVLSASPTVNSGTLTRLDVDSPGEQSYLRFNVTGVTGTVQTATLRLFVRNASSNAPSLYFTDNTWTETGITWNNKPPATGPALANVAAAAAGTWSDYDLTGDITGNGTYNFVLLPDSTDGIQYDSREGASPPQLVLKAAAAAPPTRHRSPVTTAPPPPPTPPSPSTSPATTKTPTATSTPPPPPPPAPAAPPPPTVRSPTTPTAPSPTPPPPATPAPTTSPTRSATRSTPATPPPSPSTSTPSGRVRKCSSAPGTSRTAAGRPMTQRRTCSTTSPARCSRSATTPTRAPRPASPTAGGRHGADTKRACARRSVTTSTTRPTPRPTSPSSARRRARRRGATTATTSAPGTSSTSTRTAPRSVGVGRARRRDNGSRPTWRPIRARASSRSTTNRCSAPRAVTPTCATSGRRSTPPAPTSS